LLTLRLALGLADGNYTLTVQETDTAGNTGSAQVSFTLDTAPDTVTAALSNDTGSSSSDGITMDDSLKGTADAHSAIKVYNGATLLASTTAGRILREGPTVRRESVSTLNSGAVGGTPARTPPAVQGDLCLLGGSHVKAPVRDCRGRSW
jgi:hypothetical protein